MNTILRVILLLPAAEGLAALAVGGDLTGKCRESPEYYGVPVSFRGGHGFQARPADGGSRLSSQEFPAQAPLTSESECCLLVERRSVMGENHGTMFDRLAFGVMLADQGVSLRSCQDV
jgi:hypothetical protein